MAFSQIDSLITDGVPVTCLIEPISIKVGTCLDTILFIVVSGLTESMVLGLAWWKKWSLLIDWDKTQWWVQRKEVNQQGLAEALITSHEPAARKVKVETTNTLKGGNGFETLIPALHENYPNVISTRPALTTWGTES